MAWVFCTSGAAKNKAGANVNTTCTNDSAMLEAWSKEAEDTICAIARKDVITNSGSLTTNGLSVMSEFCSDHIAQKIVGYDPEAIGTNSATFRINILENNINRIAGILKDDKNKTYLGIT